MTKSAQTITQVPFGLPVAETAEETGCTAFRENHELVRELTELPVFRQFEEAFCEIAGLPLALRPLETWHLVHYEHRRENPFCALVASRSRSCAACLSLQHELCEAAGEGTATRTCPFGLAESAVAVRVDGEVVAYLQTGQVALHEPTPADVRNALTRMSAWGIELSEETVASAFRAGALMDVERYEAIVRLLEAFADQLGAVARQVLVRKANQEPRVVSDAKRYIQEHHDEDLSLVDVARAVHVSSYYLCKLFKRSTGMNFTAYVSRLRVENAKRLLLNLDYRVGEIALQVGFQSLTHFNRMFKKLVGESPTQYRNRLRAFAGTPTDPGTERAVS